MTMKEEAALRAWLADIEETDPYIIAEVLDKCPADSKSRRYFLQQAKEVP